jgi:NAD kinase
MKFNKVLAVCKFSKIEYDKRQYNLSLDDLINKYDMEGIEYDLIIASHYEQLKCINLAKELIPSAEFIDTPKLTTNLTKDKDLIISIGGDEHFKYVYHNMLSDKLILNIRSDNLKSEGALSTCNRFNLNKMVKQMYNSSYLVDEWVTLEAELNDKPIENAIDTMYIGNSNGTKISRYRIAYGGKEEEQKSSGLIAVTGAGSTGWFRSSGGTSFSRNSKFGKFISREIYIGTKTANSIKSGEFTGDEELEVHSLMENGIIEIDSIKEYKLKRGDTIKIRVSNKCLKVMTLNHNI